MLHSARRTSRPHGIRKLYRNVDISFRADVSHKIGFAANILTISFVADRHRRWECLQTWSESLCGYMNISSALHDNLTSAPLLPSPRPSHHLYPITTWPCLPTYLECVPHSQSLVGILRRLCLRHQSLLGPNVFRFSIYTPVTPPLYKKKKTQVFLFCPVWL